MLIPRRRVEQCSVFFTSTCSLHEIADPNHRCKGFSSPVAPRAVISFKFGRASHADRALFDKLEVTQNCKCHVMKSNGVFKNYVQDCHILCACCVVLQAARHGKAVVVAEPTSLKSLVLGLLQSLSQLEELTSGSSKRWWKTDAHNQRTHVLEAEAHACSQVLRMFHRSVLLLDEARIKIRKQCFSLSVWVTELGHVCVNSRSVGWRG